MRKSKEREVAIRAGLAYYFTGKPCRRGGIDRRRVSDSKCCCDACRAAASDYQRVKYATELKYDPKFIEENRRRARDWGRNNPEKAKLRQSKWIEDNPERWQQIQFRANRNYHNRHRHDPDYQLRKQARSLVERALRSLDTIKAERLHKELGYTGQDLRDHIEALMQPWMAWENYGVEWEIDHVMPVNEFVSLGVSDMKLINKLENLQPLRCSDNASKGDSFVLGAKFEIS